MSAELLRAVDGTCKRSNPEYSQRPIVHDCWGAATRERGISSKWLYRSMNRAAVKLVAFMGPCGVGRAAERAVPVGLIPGKLAGRITYEQVAVEYEITREDIPAALDYSARMRSDKQIH